MNTPQTLQEKLEEILDDWYPGTQYTEVIPMLVQAFEEAGWIDTKKPITGDIHGVGVYEVKADFSHGQLDGLMTGSEFYTRFKAELHKKQEEMDWIASSPTFNKTWHLESSILEAAKRAAGLAGVSDE